VREIEKLGVDQWDGERVMRWEKEIRELEQVVE
jgi:hypothetical protein